MKYLLNELPEIVKKVSKSNQLLLMLDFDGTLSPIAPSPPQAYIKKSIKAVLKNLAKQKNTHIAIISGRSLTDVKKKVGIQGLIYAGNHGLEWEIKAKRFFTPVPKAYTKINLMLRSRLSFLCKQYKGTFLENKGISLAVHYRLLNSKFRKDFTNKAALILEPYIGSRAIRMATGKKVIDIIPEILWDKGRLALYVVASLKKGNPNPSVIYIGDDVTDEGAFKALRKNITIRVGYKQNSAARYFVKNTNQAGAFLARMAQEAQKEL